MTNQTTEPLIVIVDDDSSIRWVLSKALTNAHFRVISCHTAFEGLALVASKKPDLVISDIQMQGMSGLDLLENMVMNHPDIPVIMITAYADTELGKKIHELGAFDYLAKPFDLTQVVALCHNAIESHDPSEHLAAWQKHLVKHIDNSFHQGETDIIQTLQQDFERTLIERALALSGGHKQKAAKILGWGRNTLTRKLQYWEITP